MRRSPSATLSAVLTCKRRIASSAVVEIGVERQGAVEAAAAKFAGDGNPRLGDRQSTREPHRPARPGGDIGTVDLPAQACLVDGPLGADSGGHAAGQRSAQRDPKRLQLADIGIERRAKLPGRRIEMPAGLETCPRAGQGKAIDLEDTRRIALPDPAIAIASPPRASMAATPDRSRVIDPSIRTAMRSAICAAAL